jgi:hypothetical protein
MDTIKKIPGFQYHPQVAGAGPAQVRRLAGSIALRGPVPSPKLLACGRRLDEGSLGAVERPTAD